MMLMIDGSHMRASDLDYLVIREAIVQGMTLDADDFATYERGARDYPENMSGLSDDDVEALREIAEQALTYMSDRSGGAAYWYVEESCLWVEVDPEYAGSEA